MARIQVVPLTTETLGSASHTPYLIVIDRCADHEVEAFGDPGFPDRLGARGVIVTDGELTVENVDEELRRAACAAVERQLSPLASPPGGAD
jgi:hypothetical protein